MEQKRVELHLHTELSNDISVIGVEEMLWQVENYGLSGIAFTNLNNVQDFPKISKFAEAKDVKIIYGAEIDCQNQKFTLLVKNQNGIKALYKIISSIENIDLSILQENRENLLLGSNTVCDKILCDYFEIYPACNEAEEKRNREIYIRGKEMGIPVVAVSNAHYFTKEDAICRDIIRVSKGLIEDENKNLYLRTTSEMLKEFAHLGDEAAEEVVLNNPQRISDSIENVESMRKGHYDYKFKDAYEKIKKISTDKAYEIYGKPLPEPVAKRMEIELNLMKNQDWAWRYLAAHKTAKYIRESGHLVGSRGLSGSVLISFLLEITDINPLQPHYYCPKCHYYEESDLASDGFDLPKQVCPWCNSELKADGHDIPYESFLGSDGSKKSDFCINVSPEIQHSAIQYVHSYFGEGKAAMGRTISRHWRETAEHIVKEYEQKRNLTFSEEEREELAWVISGVKRGEGTHPGGIMIIPEDMEYEDFSPVNQGVTHFEFLELSNVIWKFDILSHKTLQLLEMLQKKTGVHVNEIHFNEFEDLDFRGIPGYDEEFMQELLAKTKPKSYADLVKLDGLAHGTNVWRENGEYLIEAGVSLSELPTLREDIMNDLIRVGVERKTAYAFSDKVRRGWGVRRRLPEKDIVKDLADWYYDYCSKIRYMFPKAHAVAYVNNYLRCAWFKKNYPKEYEDAYQECYDDAF